MDATIIYSLFLYLWYHLLSRSDILARPRDWVLRTFPSFLTYPLTCSLCFTWWVSLILTGFLWFINGKWDLVLGYAFTAPIINYLIDLWVRQSLSRLTPPLLTKAALIEEIKVGGCQCNPG